MPQTQPATAPPSTQPATQPKTTPSRYGRGHTDGGRRNIWAKTGRSNKMQLLKDVGGWAFQLLCSHGERLVGSASLGPNSTNNIGEFTAIFQIVQQAAILSLDHMDIHTDSNLAVQYYENTCIRDCPHLAKLWEQTEQLAIAAHI